MDYLYNTHSIVKYHDIEQELLAKKEYQDNDNNDDNYSDTDEEREYTKQDIIDVCSHLYLTELLNTLFLDEIDDPTKMESIFHYVFDQTIANEEFKNIVYSQSFEYDDDTCDREDALRRIIIDILFSQHMFYITHRCICQQINNGEIDSETLNTFRERFSDFFHTTKSTTI